MEQDRAKLYNSLRRRVSYLKVAVGLGYLAFLLSAGLSVDLRNFAAAAGSSWLQLIIYLGAAGLVYEALVLPLDYYGGHVLEARFDLARQGGLSWLADHLKASAISFALALLLFELVYALIGAYPEAWWYLGAGAFILMSLVISALAPLVILPLFYRFSPIRDESLNDRLIALSVRAGTRVRGTYCWDLSEKTSKANAALVGWGLTRRVILADSLLEHYSPEEIEAVFAHELGHHHRRHLWKLVGLQAVITFAGFFLAGRLFGILAPLVGIGGVADIAGLPLLLLIFAALALLLLPLTNGYSRHLERQADEFALDLTAKPAAFISAMRKLARDNLAELEPSPVVEFIFHSHPSIARRIRLAERFA
jgi:STE24 endopeptidase